MAALSPLVRKLLNGNVRGKRVSMFVNLLVATIAFFANWLI